MSPERWREVKALLRVVEDLGPSEQERRIRQAYPDDPAFCREVLELLHAFARTTQLLSSTKSWTGPRKKEPAPPAIPVPGDRCGPYRLKRQIGAGGMGLVFLAEGTELHTDVALKTLRVLSDQDIDPSQARTRMLDEATRQAALRGHPHIATLLHVTDCGPKRREPVLVMEYVEGTPASSQSANGPVRPKRVLRWATQVSSAVEHAHNRGILHCDLKPANIQITTHDDAKVLDFGLARAIHTASEGHGVFGGTLPYMAPEQFSENRFSEASDIYSLGVTLFELFTGRRPFEAATREDLILEILGCPAPMVSAYAPGLPKELDDVLARALAKDPRQRFRTVRALTDELNRVFRVVSPPAPAPPKPVRWIAGIFATAIVLTVLGFITSSALDLGVGRTGAFRVESPLWWPVWGLRSLIAPVVYLGGLFIGFYLIWTVCRVILGIRAVAKLCTPILLLVESCHRRVLGLSGNVRAQILLAMHATALLLLGWYFYPLVTALVTFVDPDTPGSLAELRPSNEGPVHDQFRFYLSLVLLCASASWYCLLRARNRDSSGEVTLGGLAAGSAVLILTLFAFSLPFRPLYHNSFERVSFDSETCYLTARLDREVVLFCPFRYPRTRTVSEADLIKTGKLENIFTEFDTRTGSEQ